MEIAAGGAVPKVKYCRNFKAVYAERCFADIIKSSGKKKDGQKLEQRVYERFSTEIALWARQVGQSGDFMLVEASNISAGGLLMRLDVPLETGSWLDLRFELPQAVDLVTSTVLVKHVIRQGDIFLVGAQFIEVRNYSVPELMAYLESAYGPES